MQALLKIFAVALALFPLLTWAAPTPISVCGFPDRINTATCGPSSNNINRSGTFAEMCNLTYRYRQSMLLFAKDLDDDMTAQTPVAERDFIGSVIADPELPTAIGASEMDALMNTLAKYELEMFCIGEALSILDLFKGTNHTQVLCPLLTYGKRTACLAREWYGVVASGSWMQSRSQCSHSNWPHLMNESVSFYTNLYSISAVRRYRQYLSSWNQACPAV